MPAGLLFALGAAVCYGIASVLQAAAARDVASATGLDPRLLLALARSWRYPVGLALDAVGFVLSLVALRSLPLYAVQAIVASALAVTAVVAVFVLDLRMRPREAVALLAVVVGLILVGLSAAPTTATLVGTGVQWYVLGAAAALALVSVPAARLGGRPGAWVLGGTSGLAFGVVALAARLLSAAVERDRWSDDLHRLLTAPATYALLVAAALALATYASALQRGSVVQATAPLVVGETVLPAVAGLALLGDHSRPGWDAVAVVGFVIAVGGCLVLSRYGEVEATVPRRS